jgi:hypothetical protein
VVHNAPVIAHELPDIKTILNSDSRFKISGEKRGRRFLCVRGTIIGLINLSDISRILFDFDIRNGQVDIFWPLMCGFYQKVY